MDKPKFICQWSLEILYGKQKQAVEIMKAWGVEKLKSSHFSQSQTRLMNGYVGASASFIIDEYIFNSMDDFEKALADMSKPQFKEFSDSLAPLVVPGTQKWTIYKSLE